VRKVRYEELLVGELEDARDRAPLIYLPIGSLEYHGWHLPMGFDGLHAEALCVQAAMETGGVTLPPTYWGTRGHEGYPGSLLLREETVAALIGNVLDCLVEQQYRLVVIFTGHHPEVQGELLKRVAAESMEAHPGLRVLVLDPFSLHPTDKHLEHAGCIETSAMLHLRPELVDMDQLSDPRALQAITGDCVDATVESGESRFGQVLEQLIQTVREALREL